MKLADLGLKTKPQTKYITQGYIKFSTENKNLHYKTVCVLKERMFTVSEGIVKDKKHFDYLMSIKTIKELMQS